MAKSLLETNPAQAANVKTKDISTTAPKETAVVGFLTTAAIITGKNPVAIGIVTKELCLHPINKKAISSALAIMTMFEAAPPTKNQ